MKTAAIPLNNLIRVRNRGLLLSVLEKDTILTSVKVFNSGRFILETKDWNAYWQPLYELKHKELEDNLYKLHFVWRNYIHCGFSSSLMKDFCYHYFSLLNTFLSNYSETCATQSWLSALRAVLGFECFGIILTDSDAEILAAGICTTRNPCYLLAKLKFPNSLDDSRFLPVITVNGDKKPELFFHYRQYSLSKDSPMSLFFYPAVSIEKRGKSFQLLNKFVDSIKYATDPWTAERGRQIFQGIVKPVIQSEHKYFNDDITIEFLDIGAGSSSLVATLCRKIQKLGGQFGFTPRFRLRSVDLEPPNPARFFLQDNMQA